MVRGQRICEKLGNDMRKIMDERIEKKLANPRFQQEISLREATELLTKTDGYKLSLNELKSKPKRK